MKYKTKIVFNLIIITVFLLVGCASPNSTSAVQSTKTSIAAKRPSSTPSLTNAPTLTKTRTSTPSPTSTDTPMPVGPTILYQSLQNDHSQIYLLDLDDGKPQRLTLNVSDNYLSGWTPDSQHIIYQVSSNHNNEIHIMDWNGKNDKKLSKGTDANDNNPVVSPDGTKIAFFATYPGQWELFTMDLNGNNQKSLTDNTVFNSTASWSPDSTSIAFTPWHNTESPPFVASVGVNGDSYQELTKRNEEDSEPQWSPDGSRIIFTCYYATLPQICSMKPDGTGRRQLTKSRGGNVTPVWSPDNTKIAFVSWRDSKNPTYCDDGDCNFEIYIMDADGSDQHRITDNPAEDWNPSWSPDGMQIAFDSLRDEPRKPQDCGDYCNSELYVMDVDGTEVRRLTNNNVPDWNPVWRPPASSAAAQIPTATETPKKPLAEIGGGKNQLSYWAQTDSAVNIYLINLNGMSEEGTLIGNGKAHAWSPDGRQIAFVGDSGTDLTKIYIMDADGKNKRVLVQSDVSVWEPTWSPDGKQIAYSRDHKDIYVINIDGTNDHLVLHGDSDYYGPAWSPDGKQIAFLKSTGGLQSILQIADKDGSNIKEVASVADWSAPPDWSPDGQWIAYGCYTSDWQVCLIKPDGSNQDVLTFGSYNVSPQWSPDGRWIAFDSHRDQNWEIYVMKADGSEQRRITYDWLDDFQPEWRP